MAARTMVVEQMEMFLREQVSGRIGTLTNARGEKRRSVVVRDNQVTFAQWGHERTEEIGAFVEWMLPNVSFK